MIGISTLSKLISMYHNTPMSSQIQLSPDWNITHAPKHWSTEKTVLEYIEQIIIPHVKRIRADIQKEEQAAVLVTDKFKGQNTDAVFQLLGSNNIHVCLLPPNTTDRLQPTDLTVNKPAKEFIKKIRRMVCSSGYGTAR